MVLLSLPAFNDGGPEMDEGTLVAYPSLVEEGLVPGRDFETFYGPAQPYALAGAFAVFGESQAVERVSGLVFRIATTLALFVVLLRLGVLLAGLGALSSAVLALSLGLQGLAILGGLAALTWSLALLASERRPSDTTGHARAVAGGVAAAVALTFRPDLAPAALLGAAALLLFSPTGRLGGKRTRNYLAALIAGCIPLIVWMAVVGPSGLERLLDDLSASRSGRRLPLPGLEAAEGGLIAATIVIVGGGLIAALARLWRDPYDWSGRVTLAIVLTLACLVPSMLQRADNAHVLPVASLAIGLSPIVAMTCLEELRRLGRAPAVALCGAGALVVGIGFLHQAVLALRDDARSIGEGGNEVTLGDRSFLVGSPPAAADLNRILPRLAAVTEPGDRVFVGPADLNRTKYTDTFVYYMVPALRPASFYTELNPGTANAEDSTLPDELATADAVLLTTRHDHADTDVATQAGSAAAGEVLERDFCPESRAGSYRLYLRCG